MFRVGVVFDYDVFGCCLACVCLLFVDCLFIAFRVFIHIVCVVFLCYVVGLLACFLLLL